jgi:hypothetical protein
MTMATMRHQLTTTMAIMGHNQLLEDGVKEAEGLQHHQHATATNLRQDLTQQIQTLAGGGRFTTIHKGEVMDHGVQRNKHRLHHHAGIVDQLLDMAETTAQQKIRGVYSVRKLDILRRCVAVGSANTRAAQPVLGRGLGAEITGPSKQWEIIEFGSKLLSMNQQL